MTGLLGDQMDTTAGEQAAPTDEPEQDQTPAAEAAEPSEPQAGDQGSSDELSPQALMDKIQLPPQQKQQLEKVVLAGLKVMFDPKTHKLMLDELQKPGPLPDKLGKGIAGLMALLFQQSQKSIPPQLLVPAGVVLTAHAAKFLDDAGQPVSPQDFGEAVHVMVSTLAPSFGVDPAKLDAKAAAMLPPDAGADPGADPAAAAAPDEPPAAPAKPQFKSLMG